MKNRNVGFLVIGISFLVGTIIYLFNRAMTDIVGTTCSHGSSCTMWDTISLQTSISIVLLLFVIAIGIYLIFFGKEEKIITKTVVHKVKPKKLTMKDYNKMMKKMTKDEKKILKIIIGADGTIFQSDLVKKTDFNKVKITRLLNKLEHKGIIEKRRRGLSNIIFLTYKN